MSAFASSILTGLSGDWGTLKSELENKFPGKVTSGSGGAISAASSTVVTGASASVSMVADEIAIVVGMLNFSISDGTSTLGQARLFRDSSNLSNGYILTDGGNSAGGQRSCVSIVWYDENQSGTIAYSIGINRFSGAGTVHSVNSQLFVLQLKKR